MTAPQAETIHVIAREGRLVPYEQGGGFYSTKHAERTVRSTYVIRRLRDKALEVCAPDFVRGAQDLTDGATHPNTREIADEG